MNRNFLIVRITLLAVFVALQCPQRAAAQYEPNPEDVATIDGIIKAYYEIVSGAAGEPRQWERDHYIHHPEAQVKIVGENEAGERVINIMTLSEFHERAGGLTVNGFFEYEINRQTVKYGATAHVWSTYEFKQAMDGPVQGRGINSIQLYHDGDRWWIVGEMFDPRPSVGEVPKAYMPKER